MVVVTHSRTRVENSNPEQASDKKQREDYQHMTRPDFLFCASCTIAAYWPIANP